MNDTDIATIGNHVIATRVAYSMILLIKSVFKGNRVGKETLSARIEAPVAPVAPVVTEKPAAAAVPRSLFKRMLGWITRLFFKLSLSVVCESLASIYTAATYLEKSRISDALEVGLIFLTYVLAFIIV
jgi:hypothetical protein